MLYAFKVALPLLLHNFMANRILTRIFVALLLLDFIIDMLLFQ